jgi:dimethylamine/trimethylamine dehydrogenase
VVGAGPAGLECAHVLGKRGYRVDLAEATTDLGGRVTLESRLPGFAEWARVRDYRLQQIAKLPNVNIYRESRLDAEQIAEMEIVHVVVATGSSWRRDGVGRYNHQAIPVAGAPTPYTPDDILGGKAIDGPVIVFDDDHYYMGGAIAERLRRKGLEVVLVTPASLVSEWTVFTLEQERIQANLINLGVEILPNAAVTAMHGREVETTCRFTRRRQRREAQSLVLVTARLPSDRLFDDLTMLLERRRHPTIASVRRIGDCLAPGTIGDAVFGGHQCARELDQPPGAEPFADETVVGDLLGSH